MRLCSSFMAGPDEGFSSYTYLTGEETNDVVAVEPGAPYGPDPSVAPNRQGGLNFLLDADPDGDGDFVAVPGMGRHNHENSLPIPGYGHPVVLSGDDAFNQVAAQSQVFAYIASDAAAVWNDTGDLYAFVPDEAFAAINDYFDFPVGSAMSISGHFVQVPKLIATGRLPGGEEITSATVPAELGGPYPPPPADGTWQRPPGMTSGPGVDGPQWVLEHWSDLNNAFQFTPRGGRRSSWSGP